MADGEADQAAKRRLNFHQDGDDEALNVPNDTAVGGGRAPLRAAAAEFAATDVSPAADSRC